MLFLSLCCLETENHDRNGVNQCCQESKNEGFDDEMFHVANMLFGFFELGNGGPVSENVNGDAPKGRVFES